MPLNRLVYIDTFSYQSTHEMFNASLLWICSNSTNKKLLCLATKSSYKTMVNVLKNASYSIDNIEFKPTTTIKGQGRYALLSRYLLGAWLMWFHLIFSVKKNDTVIIPFNNLFALKGINLICRLLSKKVVVCCHGEMEAIISDVNNKGILSKILYTKCRKFFLNPNLKLAKNIYFSFLGESILNNIKNILPANFNGKLHSIDHPYLIIPQVPSLKNNSIKLKVGTCGVMNYAKGVKQLVKFAQLCQQQGLDINITHIGRVNSGLDELLGAGVVVPTANSELTRTQYDSEVDSLDYILFFYGSDNYKITASGAIMDAIALQKPIIALKNEYFEYIFSKFGTFGILHNNVDEMVETLRAIDRAEINIDYDFKTIAQKFAPEKIQQVVAVILRDINKI